MNIFFGWVDPEEFTHVDTSDLFYHDGEHYWFKLVLEEDQVSIHDTCGRMIPFGYDSLEGLHKAVKIVFENYINKQDEDEHMKDRIAMLHKSKV